MLKNLAQLKFTIENRDIIILCDNDTPLNMLKEGLFQGLKCVGQIEDYAKQQQQTDATKVEPDKKDASSNQQVS
jgi:hypothetical protein